MTYQPTIPTGLIPLNRDYLNIQDNFTVLNNVYNVDHVALTNTSPPIGYHTVIHQQTQSNVNTVAGVNQIFAGVPGTLTINSSPTPAIPGNGDTQLYALTGMGGLSQLTGNRAASSGYVWCGGILIQWGNVSVGATPATVTFNQAFANNVFAISAIRAQSTSILAYSNLTKSQVTFNAVGASTNQNVSFIVIGN